MSTLLEMKTVTMTFKGQIAIPKGVREREGLKEGSKVVMMAYDDHVELRPLAAVREGLANAVMSESSLSKDWNTKEEDEAWASL